MSRGRNVARILVVAVCACPLPGHAAEDSPIARRIAAAAEGPAAPPIPAAENWIREIRSEPYEPLAAAHQPGEATQFQVESRVDKMRFAPCATCHDSPLAKAPRPLSGDQAAKSHGAIAVVHAPPERMACDTCHDYQHEMRPKVADAALDFNRAYELCAGCHSRQYADWRGGAHGKRLGNWGGTRIVRACTGCHDPHRPAFAARIPAIYAAPPSTWEALRR